MKSWISSRTNKPASKRPGEVAEVAKEEEAITAGAESVAAEVGVAVVAEVVAEVVAVVEETWSGKTKEKQIGRARSCHDKKGSLLGLKHMSQLVRWRN